MKNILRRMNGLDISQKTSRTETPTREECTLIGRGKFWRVGEHGVIKCCDVHMMTEVVPVI